VIGYQPLQIWPDARFDDNQISSDIVPSRRHSDPPCEGVVSTFKFNDQAPQKKLKWCYSNCCYNVRGKRTLPKIQISRSTPRRVKVPIGLNVGFVEGPPVGSDSVFGRGSNISEKQRSTDSPLNWNLIVSLGWFRGYIRVLLFDRSRPSSASFKASHAGAGK
jgi:hypothetical protein